MSNLAELTRQVAALNRAVKDYMYQLEDFKRHNAEHLQLIKSELQGDSSNSHFVSMAACVTAADESLKASLNALTSASAALTRVELR